MLQSSKVIIEAIKVNVPANCLVDAIDIGNTEFPAYWVYTKRKLYNGLYELILLPRLKK